MKTKPKRITENKLNWKKIEQLLKRVAYFIDTSEEELENKIHLKKKEKWIWHKQYNRRRNTKREKRNKRHGNLRFDPVKRRIRIIVEDHKMINSWMIINKKRAYKIDLEHSPV